MVNGLAVIEYIVLLSNIHTHTHTHSNGCIGGNSGFRIFPKDASPHRLEELGINQPTFQLVENLLY